MGKDLKSTGGKTVEYKKRLETYESFINNFLTKVNETGEADPDYNDPEMNRIVNSLEKKGFEAYYKEFDKYQGVYLVITKNGKSKKFWWTDTYSVGTWTDGYVNSVLIDDDNNSYSGNAGDYFNLPKDYVFDDHILIIKIRKNGKIETQRIENPKVSDLPDIIGLGKKSEFKSEQEVMDFTLDNTEDSFQYFVESGDVSEFINYFNSSVRESYGDKRDYRKIDIYIKGKYHSSTTWSKTLKEAKDKFVEKYKVSSTDVDVRFAEK